MAVLVGDSAHAMPPTVGQGTAMAFEDAVQLAASIQKLGLTQDALQDYELARKERLTPIWDISVESAITFYKYKDDVYVSPHKSPADSRTRAERAALIRELETNSIPPINFSLAVDGL
eukprot:TRINITY_DN84807_c0_g1_i1.p1 TRINITY_DN84807_c0_g1~~TRINITY_DN84807_c0_g1_i1.p1  ORF type:complete len:137 (-),score=26.08 TRINITY_DN84807_c0_g1_i1:64-417(-)